MPIAQHFQIRPLKSEDTQSILNIQTACYPAELIESADTLLAKHHLSPQSCWLAEQNHQAVGYLFTHPWHDTGLPALNVPLTALPANPDTFFLHDLAIHPAARGRGVAQALVNHAMQWAKSQYYRRAILVAVQGSRPFWEHYGFSAHPDHQIDQDKLKDYGQNAHCLMARIQNTDSPAPFA